MKPSNIDLEKANQVLESIASKFPKRSNECRALELAAKALLFAQNSKTRREFEDFLRGFNSELTAQQRGRLRDMGITSSGD